MDDTGKLRQIEYIVLDVDGTLTDGSIYYDNAGNELKKFNIKDGLAIKSASEIGVKFIVLTGRDSSIVSKRMEELGVSYLFQGVSDKKSFLRKIFFEKDISLHKVAYIGDDLNDYAAMKICGYVACPEDAVEEVKHISDYIAKSKGGTGAVREIVEHILRAQDRWKYVVEKYKQ